MKAEQCSRKSAATSSFGRLSNAILRSETLSLEAKVVLACRSTFTADWQTRVVPLTRSFRKGLGKNKARAALAEVRAAGHLGPAQALWAKKRATRFIRMREEVCVPRSDFTFVQRSWFSGYLTVQEVAALLCVAARLHGPQVFNGDVARFIGCTKLTAALYLAALTEHGLIDITTERLPAGRYAEKAYRLLPTQVPILNEENTGVGSTGVGKASLLLKTPLDIGLQETESTDFELAHRIAAQSRRVLISSSTQATDLAAREPQRGDLVQWVRDGEDQFPSPRRVRAVMRRKGRLFLYFDEGGMRGIPAAEVYVVATEAMVPAEAETPAKVDAWSDPRLLGWTDNLDQEIGPMGVIGETSIESAQAIANVAPIHELREHLRAATGNRISRCLLGDEGLQAVWWLAAYILESNPHVDMTPEVALATLLTAVNDRIGRDPHARLNSWRLIGVRVLRSEGMPNFYRRPAGQPPMFGTNEKGGLCRFA